MDRKPAKKPPMCVLVVEDDNMIGLVLKEMLEEIGFVVCAIAATENAAVEDAARFKPGVMIVDMRLAEGSGTGAMKRILATGPMPCVFVSGAPDGIARPNATMLRKPFSERELINAISHVTGPGMTPQIAL
jgi:DNA-binding response OmpR family regulator